MEKLNKKQYIINAAADLFKEKGFNATSVRDLASKVGLEPSSLYSHIKSKDVLLCDICMECAHKFMEGMNNIYFDSTSPRKKIKALIGLHLDIAYENPSSFTVFNDEWRYLPKETLIEFLDLRKEYEKKFKKILLDGKIEGKISFKNIDIIFNVILKALSWSYTGVKKYKKEELKEELTHFITSAINV